MVKLFVLLSSFLLACESSKFPSNLPKCAQGDNECIKNAVNVIVHQAQKGIPDINLIPLNPFHVDFINIVQGKDQKSPVNLVVKLTDIDVFGLDTINTFNVSGFNNYNNPANSKGEIHSTTSRITISGNYKMNGNILILPIQGNGKCNITIDNVKFTIKFTTKAVQRKGGEYARIDKLSVSLIPAKAYIHMSNLFNGDKALGKSMNAFMNENWKMIFMEMKPVIDDAVGKIVKNIMNNVFTKFPHRDLFLSD